MKYIRIGMDEGWKFYPEEILSVPSTDSIPYMEEKLQHYYILRNELQKYEDYFEHAYRHLNNLEPFQDSPFK